MSGNNQGDPAIVFMLFMALLVGFCALLWHVSRGFWLDHVFRWVHYGEIWFVNLFTHRYSACLDWLTLARVDDPRPSPMIIGTAAACFGKPFLLRLPADQLMDYYTLTMTALITLGVETTSYFRWPLAAALLAIGWYELYLAPTNKFLTKHTLESLIQTQAKMWPIISPIVKFNPSKFGRILGDPIPDKLPPFAEALSPEEWVSWNRLPVVNGIPDRDATRRAFIRQLGPRWNGRIASLPIHIRAILASYALKGAQKRDESDEFLGKLATAWSSEKGFSPSAELIKEIDKLLDDPNIGGKLPAVMNKHAWRTTAVLGALKWARANGGVLAPAQFLWIRAEDRALWYPLNNLGRRAFHSEGAGAMSHFMAEESANKPLPIPRVDTAIITLNTYLHDPDKRPVPIPPREGGAKA